MIKPHKCHYENCDYSSVESANLKEHIMYIHTREKPQKCYYDDCKYSCVSKNILNRHIKFHHTFEKSHSCSFEGCEYQSVTLYSLKLHFSRIHTEKGQQNQKKSETATFKELEKHFNIKREHRVDVSCIRSTFYKIDGISIENGIIICHENDEHQHQDRLISCECKRMSDIKSVFIEDGNDMPVVFIRYNPDVFYIDKKKQHVNKSCRIKEYVTLVNIIINNKNKLFPFNIYYLFYNTDSGQLSILSDIEYPEELKKFVKFHNIPETPFII
jgi:hypothetical protein